MNRETHSKANVRDLRQMIEMTIACEENEERLIYLILGSKSFVEVWVFLPLACQLIKVGVLKGVSNSGSHAQQLDQDSIEALLLGLSAPV